MPRIPKFKAGLLPKGVWSCTGQQFIERFCRSDFRVPYAVTARDIFDFSTARGATAVVVGGSFVSEKERPADFDCIIVFEKESQIPDRSARFDNPGAST